MIRTEQDVLIARELLRQRRTVWNQRASVAASQDSQSSLVLDDGDDYTDLGLAFDKIPGLSEFLLTALGQRLTQIEAQLIAMGLTLDPEPVAEPSTEAAE